ncbi:MAG: replication initiation protein, partial [Lachnospiraceae bacterium]|nr:replication initiation protein [Candidatus Darwinimomas equi]
SYPSFRDFNKKVLIPAVAEINNKSNLIIHAEVILTRHKASHVKFIIKTEEPYYAGINRSLVHECLDKTEKDKIPQS